jgi:hypothetical protein
VINNLKIKQIIMKTQNVSEILKNKFISKFSVITRIKKSSNKMEICNEGSTNDSLSEIDCSTGIDQTLEDLGKTPMPENDQPGKTTENNLKDNRKSSRKRAEEPVQKSTSKSARASFKVFVFNLNF